MTGGKKHPHKDYRGDYYSRRDVIKRMLALGGIGAAGAYLAFAPEDFPGSLRDHSGLRGMPVESPFQLPDFRVEPANRSVQVGVGRGGDARTMLLKALDAVGGLKHFIQPGDVVLVKPNVAFDRSPNLGATTNPAIIDTLVRLLLIDARAAEVRVADNHTYKVRVAQIEGGPSPAFAGWVFGVRPTTSYPCRLSRQAATDESTPPLMARPICFMEVLANG